MNQLRVGVIGLGQIACGYDQPEGSSIQTHIKACLSDPRLSLTCITDVDHTRAQKVKDEWSLSAEIVDLDDLFSRDLDIVCICTPSGNHLEMLNFAAKRPPRLILCEKPISREPEAALAAVARIEQAGSTIAVNFPRRWIPNIPRWINLARSGMFGCPIGANVIYSGGFWNNASHAVDMVSAFFSGENVTARLWGPLIYDRGLQDPTISLLGACGDASLWIRGVDGRVQTVFSLELLFERARIRIYDEDGVKAELALPDSIHAIGYAPELRSAESFHDKPASLMSKVWTNLADHLLFGASIACASSDALIGLRMQARLAKSL